jgi:DNA-binding IclR family transcriptional regulator
MHRRRGSLGGAGRQLFDLLAVPMSQIELARRLGLPLALVRQRIGSLVTIGAVRPTGSKRKVIGAGTRMTYEQVPDYATEVRTADALRAPRRMLVNERARSLQI